jgi:HEAT repeat protein
MTRKNRYFVGKMVFIMVATAAMAFGQASAFAADNSNSSAEKQRKLISVLQSDAPPQDKAIPCKQLAIYGTKDAVPALAPLLLDPQLASWARIALEAIPDPAADDALREALGKAQGRLLVGVINSIGVRRDAQAVNGLAAKLKDPDPAVASAAAVALGRIGGAQSAKVLRQSLANAPAAVRPAVAEGCILCAEQYLAESGKADALHEAVQLYDAVRKADIPKQKRMEAIRGAILARQTAGLPLLLEQLQSQDKAYVAIGLRVARELPGREVTEALAVELEKTSPDRQAALLLAVADRKDAAVYPAVLKAAKTGSKPLRLAAIGALEQSGNATCVAVLLEAAVGSDADLTQASKVVLARLPGKDVDAELFARMPQSTDKTRQVLIELASERRIEGALPVIVRWTEDANAGVRGAALDAIGAMGDEKQTTDLAQLLQKTPGAPERGKIEKALLALSGRCGAGCVPRLMPLAQSKDPGLRIIALHALVCVGGSEALVVVKTAINDSDEAVQDEAVRTLSTWASNWPEDEGVAEPLLALVKSGKKMSHQVLGVRGYLEYVQGDKNLKDDDKVAKVKELLTLISRPEEKRLAIAVLGTIPTGSALDLLVSSSADQSVTEESCSAIVNLAPKKLPAASREQREKALQLVVEKSKNDATKKRAQDALQKGIK